MAHTSIAAKISSFLAKDLIGRFESFIEKLSEGRLYEFEEELCSTTKDFYNLVARELLCEGRKRARRTCAKWQGPKALANSKSGR